MPEPTEELVTVIRRWDTFVVSRTLNGFVIAPRAQASLNRSLVTTQIGEVQDLFEAWAKSKLRLCRDDDDEEGTGR